MKKFITTIVAFFLILVLIFLLPMLLPNKDFETYRLDKKIESVFIGDSHVQCAIQDSLISNSKNLAINSESTYFSYYKIKKLLDENPSIKNVYLGFSYHNISSYYEDFIHGKYSKNIMPRYFDILPFSEMQQHLPNELQVFYKNYIKVKLRGTNTGYRNQFRNTSAVKESMEKRINFQYFDANGKLNEFSEINIDFLQKLLENQNVNLFLLNIPVHSYYKEHIPEEYKQQFEEIIEKNQFTILNFEEITLDDDCFIPDGDHLSEKGAKKLSLFLKNFMNENNTNAQSSRER